MRRLLIAPVAMLALAATAACTGSVRPVGGGRRLRPGATMVAPVQASSAPGASPPAGNAGLVGQGPPAAAGSGPPTAVFDHGRRDLPLVALTFDTNLTVGMEAELDSHRVASFDNRAAMDEIDRLQLPVTVFLAGLWAERYPDDARRLAADPLVELGSHSYSHRGFTARCYGLGELPETEMAADVEHSEGVLRSFSDHPTPYFRFPGGCYDATALAAVAPTGVVVIGFDVASGDAFGHSTAAIVATVLDQVRPGSIVVLHLTGGDTAPLTAFALPAIVDGLRARGFQLVRVSDLLAACHPLAGCASTASSFIPPAGPSPAHGGHHARRPGTQRAA